MASKENYNSLLMRVDFGLNGRSKAYQKGHWSEPEDFGTWALAPKAGLCLPWPSCKADLGILIDLTPAIQPPNIKTRMLKVTLNGKGEFIWKLSRADTFLLKLNTEDDYASEIEMEFESSDEPGVAGDHRPLTFALHQVSLIALKSQQRSRVVRLAQIHRSDDFAGAITSAELDTKSSISSIMSVFESLGNTCDFGHLQRSLGADLIGLLRFGGIDIRDLIRGMLDKFARLGEPGSIDVRAPSSGSDDYFVREKNYGIGWHTLITQDKASAEQISAREEWRLPFLRRKFVETIEEGEKIFILRRPEGLCREQVDAVFEVLRLISDCTILWVEQSISKVGTVESLSRNLMIGYLDLVDGRGSSSREAWLSVCVNAYLIRRDLLIK